MKKLIDFIISFIRSLLQNEMVVKPITSQYAEPTVEEWVEAMNSLDTADIKYFARPVKGLAEIYNRLEGDKKEAFKNAIMSGLFIAERRGEEFIPLTWCPGEYRSNVISAVTKIERWENNNPVWVDLPWAVVCRMYR